MSNKIESLSPAKLKAIWRQVSPADWLSLLQEYQPNNRWTMVGTSTIKGQCFVHQDNDPSMYVDLERGKAHCFGAACGYYTWDPIRFTANLVGVSYAAALTKMRKRFSIKLPKAFHENVQKIEDNAKLKRILLAVMNEELRELLDHPDDPKFGYAKKTGLVKWLEKREFPTDSVHVWPVGVFMPQARLFERLEERAETKEYRAKAYEYLKDFLAVPGGPAVNEGALAFFFFTAPDQIGRIRLRHPSLRAKDKSIVAIPDPLSDSVGVFGLNTFGHLLRNLEQYPLFVVEGEMDALSLISHSKSIGNDICVVATGGSMEKELDPLKEFGFDRAYLIPDNDPDGVGWASKLISHNGIVSRVFRWAEQDNVGKIKDIDEAVRAYGYESVIDRLEDKINLPRNSEWVSEQLENELSGIPNDDAKERTAAAARWGGVIRDDAERNAYLNFITSNYGLDKEAILKNLTTDDDTYESFVKRLRCKLLDSVYVFLTERQAGTSSSSTATAWSRRKRVIRKLPLNSKSALQGVLASDIGSLLEFTQREIGEPTFLNFTLNQKGNAVPVSVDRKHRLLADCFYDAISGIVGDLTHSDWMEELGQGIHWVEDFNNGLPAVLIANGTKFFKGELNEQHEIKFSELESPIVGKYFFKIQNQQWSKHLQSVEDIEKGLEYAPKDVYQKLLRLIGDAWAFTNHNLETQFLAADIMYTTVFSVFGHLDMVDITGESQSGKTTLLQVIGGTEFPDIRLNEAVVLLDDYTEASIRQRMNGVGLRLMLDEFEDDDMSGANYLNKRARSVRGVHELIRNMTSGSSEVIRGTTAGTHQTFKLRFPVTVSGMYTMREARDLNRYVHIRTQPVVGKRNPIDVIRENFSKEELTDLQRAITLCMLPRIPEILDTMAAVRHELASNPGLPQDMLSRLKENFMPVVATLKMVGEDYIKFLSGFSEIKMTELREQGGTARESENIWENLLHAHVNLGQYTQDADLSGHTTLSRILSDSNTRNMLNEMDIGVYYMAQHNWLIVFWQKAVQGLFRYTNKYRNVTNTGKLKSIADADPRVVSKEKLRKSVRIAQRIQRLAGGSIRISLDQVSVLDLRDTLLSSSVGSDNDSVEEPGGEDSKHRMLADIPQGDIRKIATRGDFEV